MASSSAFESEQPVGQPVAFKIGQHFKSFEELMEAVTMYETTKYVKLWIRDSCTEVAARKRLESRYLSDRIKYYEIAYCCIHSGKKFTSRGTGKCSTF
uniref:ZSWIM3 N-terminal domain-containing protein n=1 Tax=Amphimedon queenslandica TaxID=400682 RepID=A0A1X7V7V9_AMPQE